MHKVDNKFEIGQEVYLITERRERLENKRTCDVCSGLGNVIYKGYEMRCPKCNGKKDIVLDSKIVKVHTVEDKPYRIISYHHTVSQSGESLRFKLKQDFSKAKNVTEKEFFTTKEEAIAECDRLNKKKEE